MNVLVMYLDNYVFCNVIASKKKKKKKAINSIFWYGDVYLKRLLCGIHCFTIFIHDSVSQFNDGAS